MAYCTPFGPEHLNHSVRPSLGKRASITIFSGLRADNPLRFLLPPVVPFPASIEFIRAQRIMKTNVLIQALDHIHLETRLRCSKAREPAVKRHNDKTHVGSVNFLVGNYVLVAQRAGINGHKVSVIWCGPQRVTTEVSDLVFECEDLISNNLSILHANRLKFYANAQLAISDELLDTIANNKSNHSTVENLLDLRWNGDKNQYDVCTKWLGFDHDAPAPTWEPLNNLWEDIPAMPSKFLNSHPDQVLVASAKLTMAQ